jgi:hypothetical protein
MGRDLAIDASDLPAYANGQRFVSKGGRERERFSDPDASWGHRSAVSTRKGGGFYGYKIDMATCSRTGLPVAWNVRTAREAEALAAVPLLDAARRHGFIPETAAMDKGYVGPVYDACEERGIRPIIPLRNTPAVERGADKPPMCEHGEWRFAGSDAVAAVLSGVAPPGHASREAGGSGRTAYTRSSRARRSGGSRSTEAAPPSSASSVGSRTSGRCYPSAYAAWSASDSTPI